MFGGLFEGTIRIIKRWDPERKFSNEKGYSNDLTNFLRYEFNENQSPFTLGIQSRVSVTKEDALGSLKDKIFDLSGNDVGFGYNQEPGIEVIDKALRTKKRKKTSSPFDFGL